jgi:hypothetical protein
MSTLMIARFDKNLDAEAPYPLQAQSSPLWQVLSSEVRELLQALLLPGVQCLQHGLPLVAVGDGTKTVGIWVGIGAFVAVGLVGAFVANTVGAVGGRLH